MPNSISTAPMVRIQTEFQGGRGGVGAKNEEHAMWPHCSQRGHEGFTSLLLLAAEPETSDEINTAATSSISRYGTWPSARHCSSSSQVSKSTALNSLQPPKLQFLLQPHSLLP